MRRFVQLACLLRLQCGRVVLALSEYQVPVAEACVGTPVCPPRRCAYLNFVWAFSIKLEVFALDGFGMACLFAQAGTTAIIIAKQEQEMGNYKVAHAILLQTYRELDNHKLRVPQDVQRMLSLLHSYVIVKKLVKASDHMSAARMLVRVAKNISKFPSHVVPILTSTGIINMRSCIVFEVVPLNQSCVFV